MKIKGLIDDYLIKNDLSRSVKYTVTIPASFEANQRMDLMQCLENANIDVENSCLIDEPNAAFLSYFLNSSEKTTIENDKKSHSNVLVFDFGAGTCDISILEINKSHHGIDLKNVAISQYSEIGGDNIDERIVYDFLLPQMLKKSKLSKKDLWERDLEEIIPRLMPFAEELKILFSKKIALVEDLISLTKDELKEHTESLNHQTLHINNGRLGTLKIESPTMNLANFIDVCNQFCFDVDYEQIGTQLNPVLSALEKAKLAPEKINQVLFIGGSSKNIIIRNQVMSIFTNSIPIVPIDPQSHVSKGAALNTLLLNQFNTQIIRPITNSRIFTLIRNEGIERKISIVDAGIEVPFSPMEIDKFRPQRNGQKTIEIPLFLSDKNCELAKVELKSDSESGFLVDDKIKLSIEINVNKEMKFSATVNNEEIAILIENPFTSTSNSLKDKKVQEAIKKFNLATKKHNGTPQVAEYDRLIKVYTESSQKNLAAELLEEAVFKHKLTGRFNELSILYGEAGRSDKSRQYAKKALEQSPQNATLLLNMAVEVEFNDRELALECLQKAIAITPNDPVVLYKLGQMLNNEKGEGYIKKGFDIWQLKYKNGTMRSWDYSWFESCANRLGKHDLSKEINKSNLDKSDSGFYDDKNLMSGHFKTEE